MFVLALILIVLALAGFAIAYFAKRRVAAYAAGGVLLLGLVLVATSSFYSQDTGEASVVVAWTGDILGQETTPGLHGKAPWSDVHTFSVRNQQVSFVSNGRTDYSGGSAEGPQITASDRNGVSDNIDINVRYSIRPDQVTNIYREFRDEDTFVQSYVVNTVRSTVRDVPNSFSTLDLITKRAAVNTAIQTALAAAWQKQGVSVDSVSLQDIRPPQSVTDSYAAAQQAQIKVTTEKANLQAAQVSAQQQVVQADAKAKANDVLNRSLTTNVLKQNYLDTLAKLSASGNVVVVPQGFNGIVNVK